VTRAACTVAAALALAAGCGSDGGGEGGRARLPQGAEPARLDPHDFSTRIDNPYLPLAPGSRWVYRETGGEGGVQRVDVTVTPRTRRIAGGVEARVVHDVVSEAGRTVEDTYDWYAQDRDGNVWYLGEDTKEYAGGKASTEGSWEAGVRGAQAGVAMPAAPRTGMAYRQEHYAGQAEDRARILSLDEQAEVPAGHFTHALLTRESTPLEPRVLEYKLYAKGVGVVLTLTASGGGDREELVRYERGRG
jgi:hypothetical protein